MKKLAQYLTIMIVFIQLTAQTIVHFATNKSENKQVDASNYYMLCDAICWTLAFAIIAMLVSGLFRQLAFIVAFLWACKVIDELYFDPCVLSWNDLITFNIAQCYAVYVISKNHFKKHK